MAAYPYAYGTPAVYPPSYVNYSTPVMAQSNPGIVWVQGIEAAKSYLVGAGQSVLLMDSENNVFYIKSTDQSGMPMPLRVFDYTERQQTPGPASSISYVTYVTHDEFQKAIEELRESMKGA